MFVEPVGVGERQPRVVGSVCECGQKGGGVGHGSCRPVEAELSLQLNHPRSRKAKKSGRIVSLRFALSTGSGLHLSAGALLNRRLEALYQNEFTTELGSETSLCSLALL